MSITLASPTPAQAAASEFAAKVNKFTAEVKAILANGVSAEGSRPAVPASALLAQFPPSELAKLESIAALA